MAAALAAVDARFAKKEPKAEEMDSFAEDLQIGEVVDEFSDEHEDFEEGEMDFAIDDEIHIDVDDDFDEPEAFQDDGVEEDVAIADSTAINALKREYTRISKQLSASEQARNDLEERVASRTDQTPHSGCTLRTFERENSSAYQRYTECS